MKDPSSMAIEFRIATKQDDSEATRRKILEFAMDYVKESLDSEFTAPEIEECFDSTIRGLREEFTYWMFFDEGSFEGYMLTMFSQAMKGVHIVQGFMSKGHRHHAGFCLSTIEQEAKKFGLTYISLLTKRDHDVYRRWIGKFGFKTELIAFRKEI